MDVNDIDSDEFAAIHGLIILATHALIRSSRANQTKDITVLAQKIVEVAGSPEKAVGMCLATFAGAFDQSLEGFGVDAAKVLQDVLLQQHDDVI